MFNGTYTAVAPVSPPHSLKVTKTHQHIRHIEYHYDGSTALQEYNPQKKSRPRVGIRRPTTKTTTPATRTSRPRAAKTSLI